MADKPIAHVPDGWSVKPVSDGDNKGFIIGTPRVDGVRSNTSVWLDDEDPAHQLLATMLADQHPATPAEDGREVGAMHGCLCGGDSTLNTVNVKLDTQAPWDSLPLGTRLVVFTQPARQVGGDEREAFVAWLAGTFPAIFNEADAIHHWQHDHASALAWKARASLAAPAAVPTIPQQWEKSISHCWPKYLDDKDGDWCVGTADEDGRLYEVLLVEASQYDAPGESQKIAEAIVNLWGFAAAPVPPQQGHGDSRAVVMPKRADILYGTMDDMIKAEEYNEALDEVARLNAHTVTLAELEGLRRDAGRWRAFINCARIKFFGWSGYTNPDPNGNDPKNYRHFGAEFWSIHEGPTSDKQKAHEILNGFADAAIAQQGQEVGQ